MKIDDTVTFEGIYERRTFWQWLTRQPKQLKKFRAKGTVTAWEFP